MVNRDELKLQARKHLIEKKKIKNQWLKNKVVCVIFSLAIIIGATSLVLIFTFSNKPVYHESFYNYGGLLIRNFSARDGMAVVTIDRNIPVIIDISSGREIKRFERRRVHYFDVLLKPDGLVHVSRRGRYAGRIESALLDIETGNEIIPFGEWDRFLSVSNGMAIVEERRDLLSVIDLETGNELVPLEHASDIRFTSDTMVEVRPHRDNVSNEEWNRGVVNVIDLTTGEKLPPIPLADFGYGAAIVQSYDGLAVVELLDGSVALIDLETGHILISFDEFCKIRYFSHGMAVVRRDEETGLIDIASGDEIIPFGGYGYYHILSENTVAVLTHHTTSDRSRYSYEDWGIVDIPSGVETIPIGEFSSRTSDYREGFIPVVYFPAVYTGQLPSTGVIDTASGEEIIPFGRYHSVILLPDGFVAIFDIESRLWHFENLADYLQKNM